jgi:hypothetical protein
MKKRIQITESERQSILRLHEEYKMSLLSEQSSTGTTTGNTTTTGATTGNTTTTGATTGNTTTERFKTATCAGLKKGPRCKDKVLQVQIKINDKCPADKLPAKLVEDGLMGPKTSSAFTACGGVISGQGQSGTGGEKTPSELEGEAISGGGDASTGGTPPSSGGSPTSYEDVVNG